MPTSARIDTVIAERIRDSMRQQFGAPPPENDKLVAAVRQLLIDGEEITATVFCDDHGLTQVLIRARSSLWPWCSCPDGNGQWCEHSAAVAVAYLAGDGDDITPSSGAYEPFDNPADQIDAHAAAWTSADANVEEWDAWLWDDTSAPTSPPAARAAGRSKEPGRSGVLEVPTLFGDPVSPFDSADSVKRGSEPPESGSTDSAFADDAATDSDQSDPIETGAERGGEADGGDPWEAGQHDTNDPWDTTQPGLGGPPDGAGTATQWGWLRTAFIAVHPDDWPRLYKTLAFCLHPDRAGGNDEGMQQLAALWQRLRR